MNIHVIFFSTDEFECADTSEKLIRSMLGANDVFSKVENSESVPFATSIKNICDNSSSDILLFICSQTIPCKNLISIIRNQFTDPSVVFATTPVAYYKFNSGRTIDTLGIDHNSIISEYIKDNSSIKNYGDLIFSMPLPTKDNTNELIDLPFDFSSLCAIRRDAYIKCNGFDTNFSTPLFLFLELNKRLRSYGRFIALNEIESYMDTKRDMFVFSSLLQNDISTYINKYDDPIDTFDFFPWADYKKALDSLKATLGAISKFPVHENAINDDNSIYYGFASENYPNGICQARINGNTIIHQRLGLRLPYKPGTFKTAVLSAKWALLPQGLLAIILQEALRIADEVKLDRHIENIPSNNISNDFGLSYPIFFGQLIVEHIGVFDFSKKDENYIYVQYPKNSYISFEKNIDVI